MESSDTSNPPTDKRPVSKEKPARLLLQLNQRLIQSAAQLNQIQADVDKLSDIVEDDGAQISALVGRLTDTQSAALLQRRLAELTEQMSAEHEQLNFLGLKLTELATQDQIVRLASTVATQGQVTELLEIVHDQVRTQELANRFSDTREEHVEALLGTLREIVTHRQSREEQVAKRDQDEVNAIRRTARGEFAADLLPALDGLEIAVDRAHEIMSRQREDLAALAQTPIPARTADGVNTNGLFDKLRSRVSADANGLNSEPLPAPESMAATLSATEAWLNHLTLVRDRFVTLLTLEGVEPVPTLDEVFDPRIHIALESEIRTDVEPNTIVRELRKGYRHDNRVLRYAEVVIAQAPDTSRNS